MQNTNTENFREYPCKFLMLKIFPHNKSICQLLTDRASILETCETAVCECVLLKSAETVVNGRLVLLCYSGGWSEAMATKLWASKAASYLRISVFHRGFATGNVFGVFVICLSFLSDIFRVTILVYGLVMWKVAWSVILLKKDMIFGRGL